MNLVNRLITTSYQIKHLHIFLLNKSSPKEMKNLIENKIKMKINSLHSKSALNFLLNKSTRTLQKLINRPATIQILVNMRIDHYNHLNIIKSLKSNRSRNTLASNHNKFRSLIYLLPNILNRPQLHE